MPDGKTLKEVLAEQMAAKGLSVPKLRQMTGIAERYLAALVEGRPEKLPPAPYVRGYLMKIASVLQLDGAKLWELYREHLPMATSGELDRLPYNRFALKKINKAAVIGVAAGLVIAVYLGISASRLLGTPLLTVTSPAVETYLTTASAITLIGRISPDDKLLINGEEVPADAEGRFQTDYPLEPGLNTIEFTAKKFLGGQARVTRQVLYQPAELPPEEPAAPGE